MGFLIGKVLTAGFRFCSSASCENSGSRRSYAVLRALEAKFSWNLATQCLSVQFSALCSNLHLIRKVKICPVSANIEPLGKSTGRTSEGFSLKHNISERIVLSI